MTARSSTAKGSRARKPRRADEIWAKRHIPKENYSVTLLFKHSSIDPAAITEALGIKPTLQWRAGAQWWPDKDHRHAPFTRPETLWSLRMLYYEDEPDLDKRLAEFLEPLLRNASFVRRIVEESIAAEIDLSFPGQFYAGAFIGPKTLGTIAELKLGLGLEVFPDSAPWTGVASPG